MMQKLIQRVKDPLAKHGRILAIAIVAFGTFAAMIPAHAQNAAVTDTLAAVAIAGLFAGAAVSSFRGWYTAPDNVTFSIKKLAGALLLAMIQVPMQAGIANLFSAIPDSSSQLAIIFMLFGQAMALGFTIDTLHTATKN